MVPWRQSKWLTGKLGLSCVHITWVNWRLSFNKVDFSSRFVFSWIEKQLFIAIKNLLSWRIHIPFISLYLNSFPSASNYNCKFFLKIKYKFICKITILECNISGYFINYINNIFVLKISDGLDLFLPLSHSSWEFTYITLDLA